MKFTEGWRYWQALCASRAVLLNLARPGGSTLDLVDPVAGPVRVYNSLDKPERPGGSTHDPGEPGQDPFFFPNMGFETHWYITIYTLCSQEKKSCFFNMR